MIVGDLVSVDLKAFGKSMNCLNYLLRKYDNLPLRIEAGLICYKKVELTRLGSLNGPRYRLQVLIDDGRLINLPYDFRAEGIFVVQEKAQSLQTQNRA